MLSCNMCITPSVETVSHYVAQIGFELRYSSLHFPSAWIMGICDHTQQTTSAILVFYILISSFECRMNRRRKRKTYHIQEEERNEKGIQEKNKLRI